MEYEFNHDTTSLKIETEIDNISGAIKAVVNEKPIKAGVITVTENHLILNIDGKSHKAYVIDNDANLIVQIDGRIISLIRTGGEKKSFATGDHEFGAKDRVMSPMPGKVVKILVEVGETVKTRQPLVIVESMKMENEIKSPADGTITAINFKDGDLVGTGQPIILLEPAQ
jgi:acetyl/propionyl-CoA carboxylase alpha subunit